MQRCLRTTEMAQSGRWAAEAQKVPAPSPPRNSLAGSLILANPRPVEANGLIFVYLWLCAVLYITCYIFKPVNSFLKRLHTWAKAWATPGRKAGDTGRHPTPGRLSQETRGFLFLEFSLIKAKRRPRFLHCDPFRWGLKAGYKSEMEHTLTELYLSSFLIKQKTQKHMGVQFFFPRQRQKPATSSLLLLSCCQVGDLVKIGSASHLFIWTIRVAICKGALLVWPGLLLPFVLQDCSTGSKRRLTVPPLPRVTSAHMPRSPWYHPILMTNTGRADRGRLWRWLLWKLLFLNWPADPV